MPDIVDTLQMDGWMDGKKERWTDRTFLINKRINFGSIFVCSYHILKYTNELRWLSEYKLT